MVFSRSPCFRWHSPFLLDRQPLPSAFLLCLHSSPCLILRESKLTTPVLHITVCSFRDFEQILIWDNRKTLHLTCWYMDSGSGNAPPNILVYGHYSTFTFCIIWCNARYLKPKQTTASSSPHHHYCLHVGVGVNQQNIWKHFFFLVSIPGRIPQLCCLPSLNKQKQHNTTKGFSWDCEASFTIHRFLSFFTNNGPESIPSSSHMWETQTYLIRPRAKPCHSHFVADDTKAEEKDFIRPKSTQLGHNRVKTG